MAAGKRVPALARAAVLAYLFGESAWLLLLPLLAAAGASGLALCYAAVARLHAMLMCALSLRLLRHLGEPASRAAALLLIPLIPIGVARASGALTAAATILPSILWGRPALPPAAVR